MEKLLAVICWEFVPESLKVSFACRDSREERDCVREMGGQRVRASERYSTEGTRWRSGHVRNREAGRQGGTLAHTHTRTLARACTHTRMHTHAG